MPRGSRYERRYDPDPLDDMLDAVDRQKLAGERAEQHQRQETAIHRDAMAASATRTEEAILAEYAALGLEPYRSKGILVSLPMLRSLGWSVQEVEGQNKLVKPPARTPEPPREELGR